MARAYTYTRTGCIPPENMEERMSGIDLTIPTLESIITQIEVEIPQLSQEAAKALADTVYQEFKSIKDDEFGRRFGPTKPRLDIEKWSNAMLMFERMRYPADYSCLTMYPGIEFGGICFHIVVIHAVKCIVLHYVEAG